jgi:ubiquinone/menaquinone biosynthesis C-methylase UbiE
VLRRVADIKYSATAEAIASVFELRVDDHVRYGDIVKGLPVQGDSGDGLFCSRVLEHLSLVDCSAALHNSFRYLKPGGIFRIIVPDLDYYIERDRREKLDEAAHGPAGPAMSS